MNSPIPTRLLIPGPPDTVKTPPSKANGQLLPFGDLSFDNFQRLCVRLLTSLKDVSHCQEFGDPGQKQDGIDLYARTPAHDKLEVWQCKRYIKTKFQPSHIKDAVQLFLDGKFIGDTRKFVIVTSAGTEDSSIADAEIDAAKILKESGIEFELIGCTKLTALLKDFPKIIDDFFQREWVKECCGELAVKGLEDRLSAEDVFTFRNELRKLYTGIFEQTDSFISCTNRLSEESSRTPILTERWVIPTIIQKSSANVSRQLAQDSGMAEAAHSRDTEQQSEPSTPPVSQYKETHFEMSADAFLGDTNRGVILGEPGHGKSTLLRVVALDLLSEVPALQKTAENFGDRLPVWLPFPFLSTMFSQGKSLEEAAVQWLHVKAGNNNLPQLVRKAMRDDRLLLLIDGLDEWSRQDIAQQAVIAIQGFLSNHEAACLATARPLGYQRLDPLSGSWRHAYIKELSISQQDAMAGKIISGIRSDTTQALKDLEIDRFIRSLKGQGALRQIAANPLLLIGLLSLWFQKQNLPQSRLEVCGELVKVLLNQHRITRAAASELPITEHINSDLMRSAIASLAFQMHQSDSGSFLSKKETLDTFARYFEESEGMGKAQAREVARQMLPLSDQVIGVLSEATPEGDVQFIHRTFQEYLAAEHLSSLPMEEQTALCEKLTGDTSWHHVLLFLLLQSKRSDETFKLLRTIEKVSLEIDSDIHRKLLIAKAIFSTIRLQPDERLKRVHLLLDEVESGTWMPFRETLLEVVLNAPQGTMGHEILQERLKNWLPLSPCMQFGSIASAIENWAPCPETDEVVWRLLNFEHIFGQIEAAKCLAKRCGGNDVWKKRLLDRLHQPLSGDSIAAVLLALARGWATDNEILAIFRNALTSEDNAIRLIATYGLVKAGVNDEAIKKQLLTCGHVIYFSEFFIECVLEGWPGDEEILESSLKSISSPIYNTPFSDSTALEIAIRGYPSNERVAEKIAKILLTDQNNWILMDILRRGIASSFNGHPLVRTAAETVLTKRGHFDSFTHGPLCALAKTSTSKQLLLDDIRKANFMSLHSARALQEGWGNDDPDVIKVFREFLSDEKKNIAYAHYNFSKIEDKDAYRAILISKLKKGRPGDRFDLVISGLAQVRTNESDGEIVDAAIEIIIKEGYPLTESLTVRALITSFSDHPKVKKLALGTLGHFECDLHLLAKNFGEEEMLRVEVFRSCRSLPENLRFIIAEFSRQRSPYDSAFRNCAKNFNKECDSDVRSMLAIAEAETIKTLQEQVEPLIEIFANDIVGYGSNYEARHEAAVLGLIALGELHQIESFRNREGKPAKIQISYSQSGRDLLATTLVKKWDYLASISEGNPLNLFENNYNTNTLLETARNLGNEFVENDILVKAGITHSIDDHRLEYAARNNLPGWEDACFRAMGLSKNRERSVRSSNCETAIRVLNTYSTDKAATTKRLESIISEGGLWINHALELLSRVNPTSSLIDDEWRKYDEQKMKITNLPVWLIALKSDITTFTEWLLERISSKTENNNRYLDRADWWYILRRVSTDQVVSRKLLEVLEAEPTFNHMASLPWLIRGSNLEGCEARINAWAARQWSHFKNIVIAPFGFNVLTGSVDPVMVTLLEILLTDKKYIAR